MSSKFVFDTNTLISAALSPLSTNAQAMKKAETLGQIVYSVEIWQEFLNVLFRSKFDKYFSIEKREEIADRFQNRFKEVQIVESIIACRDPKDDKYLSLTISCKASCLITGDADLLVLHPFRGTPIMNAADFLRIF